MTPNEILKQTFGYPTFRPGQEDLINAILNDRDVLAVMPTGAGKSICYQVPALKMPGTTIVVSPLISLMKDQVQALNQAGVHAAYINSSLTESQIDKALSLAASGRYKLIYVAPERLETASFLSFARQASIPLVAVDEAHCISQWGQDFRPSYLNITTFIKQLPTRPAIAAFTATATDRVRRDISGALDLNAPYTLVTGFDRPNLFFSVKHPKSKLPYLLHYLSGHENECGIVYCSTRKNVDKLTSQLTAAGFSAAGYHAGMSDAERKKNQDDFIYDRINIIVATNAFGMGIDKSNVRFVVHYNMPQSVENYYQEAGRAGRDGVPSECLLLYSPQDIVTNRFLINNGRGARPDYNSPEERRLQKMIHYCTDNVCLRHYILNYFGETAPTTCNFCSVCQGEPLDEPSAYKNNAAHAISPYTAKPAAPSAENAPQQNGATDTNIYPRSKKKAAKRASGATSLNEADSALFDRLRLLRTEIAKAENVPPYVVFADKTLIEMAARKPQTREEMLTISGLGEYKLTKYGSLFSETIEKFLAGNEIPDTVEVPAPLQKKRRQDLDVFYITESEAASLPLDTALSAADFAARLRSLRIPETVTKLYGTTITARLEEMGLVNVTKEGSFQKFTIPADGETFGLFTETRTSQKGKKYDTLMLTPDAQAKILQWYVK